jgi:hypothetical protein
LRQRTFLTCKLRGNLLEPRVVRQDEFHWQQLPPEAAALAG